MFFAYSQILVTELGAMLNLCPRFLFFLSFLTLVSSSPFSFAAPKPKTNVVLIVIDDLGRNDVGCYGSKFYRTPNIDALALSGVRFNDFYAACPVCSPTRASIMTGKYPARLHLTDWLPGRGDRPDQKLLRPQIKQQLPLEEITIAEVLSKAGYVTGHIGKWHLGGEGFGPKEQGFQVNIAGDHTGTPLSYFAPFKNNQGKFMPGLESAQAGEYLPDRLAIEAEKFIEANKDKPFFLYLPHYSVHTPMRAKEEKVSKYKTDGKPGSQNNPVYAAMVESMDEAVGKVVKKLEDLKIADNTAIFFTSDNGGLSVVEGNNTPATTNAPLREGKGFLYEGGIRVAMIAKIPSFEKKGIVNKSIISSIDLFPTILDICEVKHDSKIDGVSFLPTFKGEMMHTERPLYWHYPHYANQGGKPGSAIRLGKMKLIEFAETGRMELFDVDSDISENKNLAFDKPEIVTDLSSRLIAWRGQVDAQPNKPNPNYKPNPQAADGSVLLHSKTAEVHGVMLRYEPAVHKNTLGFWVNEKDWASWEFVVTMPKKFKIEVLQGCGTGQGGSDVSINIGDKKFPFVVEDTGGFQMFKPRIIGEVEITKAGKYSLEIRVVKKAKSAVMDVRQIRLIPADAAPEKGK